MGNSESTPLPGGGSQGYHVLRVQDNSPGQLAGLEAFFDFIVAVGNKRLDQDDESFKQILSSSIDKPLELTVYNSKSQTVRQTQIVPSNSWGGQGILGISIRFCSFDGANQNVWHIISVHPNSPAYQAGLQAEADYVLGAESVLQQADDLIALVQANVGKALKLYVYNVNTDAVREVTLTPNDGWGGDGYLGCDIGYGYLHRIPASVDRSNAPVVAPENVAVPSSNIAQPGFTGIPQVDQIQSSSANQVAAPQFPDPSQFSMPPPADVTTSAVHVSFPVQENGASTSHNVGVSSPSPVSTIPPVVSYEPPSVPNQYSHQAVSQESAQINYHNVSYDNTAPPTVTSPPQSNYPPSSYYNAQYPYPPQVSSPPTQPMPPSNLPPSNPPPSSVPPPSIPQSSAPVNPPPTPAESVGQPSYAPSPTFPQQVYSPPNFAQGISQTPIQNQPEVPINTSSYQPYLAYGAPVPPTYQQDAYNNTAPQQPPQSYYQYQPPTQPPSSLPQPPMVPPSLNFPMPPLSSLGINTLVPPVGQYAQADPNAKPQF